jgi:predicted Fe-S protein YdhL (DUF1289 family)
MPYRSQNHYKGVCAKCGKEGHSIARCRHATAEEKNAFFKKVKETKARKASVYQNNDKSVKRTDNNKKVKFNDNKMSQNSDTAAMQQ